MANCDQPAAPSSYSCTESGYHNVEQTVVIECPEGSSTLPVSVTVPAGRVFSSISQEDADEQAFNKATQDAEAAFSERPCVFYNDEVTYTASCPDTEDADCTGSDQSSFTVYAGEYSSLVSKLDANAIALAAATTAAQASLSCSFVNIEQQATATCPEGTGGEPVTITVEAGTVVSFIDQADADAQALALAQSRAESLLVCVWGNTEQEYTAACQNDTVGDPVTTTILAGTYTSQVSQEDANALALAAAVAQSNLLLDCVWENTEQAFTATCPGNVVDGVVVPSGAQVGDSVTVVVLAGTYTSSESQLDADSIALLAAQSEATDALECQWTNSNQSFIATCPDSNPGFSVLVTVPGGSFFSEISQADADEQALEDATETAEAEVLCATDWRTVIYQESYSSYWHPNDPLTITTEDIDGFHMVYSGSLYPVLTSGEFDTTGRDGFYANLEVEFDYVTDTELTILNGGASPIYVPFSGSGSVSFILPNSHVGNGIFFFANYPGQVTATDFTISNFRYRFTNLS